VHLCHTKQPSLKSFIQYIPHNAINKQKWDDCIQKAYNSLPYAYSWYLNIATQNQWDALVLDDYTAVMPLPYKRKFRIYYIYSPFFIQQLGIFSEKEITKKLSQSFLIAIPKHFRYVDTFFNSHMKMLDDSHAQVNTRVNYVLSLNKPYELLHKAYNKNAKRNIKKAKKNNLRLVQNIAPSVVSSTLQTVLGQRLPYTNKDYARLYELMKTTLSKKLGQIWGIYSENGLLLGVNFFLFHQHRIINLISVNTAVGRTQGATFLIHNHLIEKYANTATIFDFEGSMIPSIAKFYQSFGAVNMPYYHYQKNALPKYLRWLKK